MNMKLKSLEASSKEIWQLLLPNIDVTNPPLLAKDTEKQK